MTASCSGRNPSRPNLSLSTRSASSIVARLWGPEGGAGEELAWCPVASAVERLVLVEKAGLDVDVDTLTRRRNSCCGDILVHMGRRESKEARGHISPRRGRFGVAVRVGCWCAFGYVAGSKKTDGEEMLLMSFFVPTGTVPSYIGNLGRYYPGPCSSSSSSSHNPETTAEQTREIFQLRKYLPAVQDCLHVEPIVYIMFNLSSS